MFNLDDRMQVALCAYLSDLSESEKLAYAVEAFRPMAECLASILDCVYTDGEESTLLAPSSR